MSQSTEPQLNSFKTSSNFITSQPICFILVLKKSSFSYNFTVTKMKTIGWLFIKILQIKVYDFLAVKPGFCRLGRNIFTDFSFAIHLRLHEQQSMYTHTVSSRMWHKYIFLKVIKIMAWKRTMVHLRRSFFLLKSQFFITFATFKFYVCSFYMKQSFH